MTSGQQKEKQQPGKRHKWLRRSLLVLIGFAAVLVLVRATLPYSIILGVSTWLTRQGITSSIEDINIDVIGGKFTLINASGTGSQGPAFRIGLVDIHWQWRPMSEKVIYIERIALRDINLDVQQFDDAAVVAGITIPLGGNAPAEETTAGEDDSVSWAASLDQVDFSGLEVCYQKFESNRDAAGNAALDYCTTFTELTWNGSIGYATDRDMSTTDIPLVSQGDFSLSGFTVTDRRLGKTLLHAGSTQLDRVSIKGLSNISVDQIAMTDLSALQRDDKIHRDAVRFDTLHLAGLRLRNLNALDVGSIRIDSPGLYILKQADGVWEYQQWIPSLAATDEKSINAGESASGQAFIVAIHDVTINRSDFCYDESGSLYYCLDLESMQWKGSAGFENEPLYINGKLQLSGLKILNRTLQRELLAFDSVTLDGIDIKDMDNVKLDGLDIRQLTALQRSEKADDNSLWFSQLEASPVVYSSGTLLDIGKISLEGIGISVSLNEDGSWEFDKWKPAAAESEVTEDAADASAESAGKLDIALGEFTLTTEQRVEFGDNSVSPPLDIGLKRIDFSINKLDSRNAGQKSPFKLDAATTRHGTIELAGLVSPFEAKPSFDAQGKLSGMDLRALSPATKKHIGHVIRSGQLDAGLELLSVGGQLDSNVSLVLYQFELKALSSQDAAELEKSFGMPINQSLSLLRDKDNSIHLDIPITGDISSPDFDPTDAIIKATSKATAFTLITFYTPYGLVYAGGNILFDLATALNFDPLVFDAGSTIFNRDNREQLDKLATLLTERPQVHLTLCGLSDGEDRLALFPDSAATDKKPAPPLTPEQQARLMKLANDRQNNIKNFLIEQKGITHDRLILCEPAYDADTDALGGVEINI